jgi:predicted HAD superfamily Cof-like phosphohydrolase
MKVEIDVDKLAAIADENQSLKRQVMELQSRMTEMLEEHRLDDGQLVRAHHRHVGLPILEAPTPPSEEVAKRRLALIGEEFFELCEEAMPFNPALRDAVMDEIRYSKPDVRSLPKFAHELADLQLCCEGTWPELGITKRPVIVEVMTANLRKERGSARLADGKFRKPVKPPGWEPADVPKVLRSLGWSPPP